MSRHAFSGPIGYHPWICRRDAHLRQDYAAPGLRCSSVQVGRCPQRLARVPLPRHLSSIRSRNLQTHSLVARLSSEDGLRCLVRRQRVDRTYGRDFMGSSGQRQGRATRQCDQAACIWLSKLLEESTADMAELGMSLKDRFAKHALSRPCAFGEVRPLGPPDLDLELPLLRPSALVLKLEPRTRPVGLRQAPPERSTARLLRLEQCRDPPDLRANNLRRRRNIQKPQAQLIVRPTITECHRTSACPMGWDLPGIRTGRLADRNEEFAC